MSKFRQRLCITGLLILLDVSCWYHDSFWKLSLSRPLYSCSAMYSVPWVTFSSYGLHLADLTSNLNKLSWCFDGVIMTPYFIISPLLPTVCHRSFTFAITKAIRACVGVDAGMHKCHDIFVGAAFAVRWATSQPQLGKIEMICSGVINSPRKIDLLPKF